MVEKCTTLAIAVALLAVICAGPQYAVAQDYDQPAMAAGDPRGGYDPVAKVKPEPDAAAVKVKPYPGFGSSLRGLSRFNPLEWVGPCLLPTPNPKQFVAGPQVFFANLRGEARRTIGMVGIGATKVNFDDHLGFRKSGNTLWEIDAHYQFLPRWGLRYSFRPISMDSSYTTPESFAFSGQTFTAGSQIRSKLEHFTHRAGLVFDVTRHPSSATSVFAEWTYVQRRLTIANQLGIGTSAVWDQNSSLATLGVEFNKCVRNYKGNTLALNVKGSVTFLDDHLGYDAEAALKYIIPIRQGRFGFIKGGYRYAHLKKERDADLFDVAMDGAFLQVGFLF
ncbi:MAG: hypothetical protein AB1646_23620 [Thermodesulfobacteriota bacterium]